MQNTVGQPQTVQVPNYSGVNIQIFNPSVVTPGANAPVSTVNSSNYTTSPVMPVQSYPPNYYVQNMIPAAPVQPAAANINANATATATANGNTEKAEDKKKTEKREIVQLTDDYIMTLENYLNNQNTQIRLMGAKEVVARLQEDESRKDDAALNALINKMLQDPSQKVRFLALAALNTRAASGDKLTVQLLQQMQQQQTAYGDDSAMASEILLKMSGQTVQKEFEVKEKKSHHDEGKK